MSHDGARSRRSSSSAAASPASGCAKELAKHDVAVTLLDRNNYHQFQPLLYQVATAELSTTDIARPLRAIFDKDADRRRQAARRSPTSTRRRGPSPRPTARRSPATTSCSPPARARTSSTRPGAEQHAFPLYTVDDAKALRTRLFEVFEAADNEPGSHRRGRAEHRHRRRRPDRRRDGRRRRRPRQPGDAEALPRPRRQAHPHLPRRPRPGRPRRLLRQGPRLRRRASCEHNGVILRLDTGVSEIARRPGHAQRRHRDPDPHRGVGRRHPGARAGRQARPAAGPRRAPDRRSPT